MGRHQDPGAGERSDRPPPVPQAEDEGGGGSVEGGGGEGAQATDGQEKGPRDCRNEVPGEFYQLVFMCIVY